jgi:AraC-like DNA-binding protein
MASATERCATPLHSAVLKALDFLKKEFESESLKKLAMECGVSSAYLSRIFKQEVGVPINRYRNMMRIERFWQIRNRATRHMTLSEVVYEAGFGSYAQFSKIYRSTFGRCPREIDKKFPPLNPAKTHPKKPISEHDLKNPQK